MARFTTQIQWGGPDGGWHDDADLEIVITNRNKVFPADRAPQTGTQVSWSGPQGNGQVTFFDDGTWFTGSAQFPKEGPVGYRGQVKK
jgi:hypothetical protein